MLRFNRITKYFGDQLILSELNFLVDANTRVGIVGPNGCGKSTLLRIAHGDLEPDEGNVSRSRDCIVAMLLQLVEVPTLELSGGEQQRLALETTLSEHSTVLLLDEPTNNLDEPSIAWLEQQLVTFRGPVVVVSHDRTFLDRVVSSILEMNPITGECTQYGGNYSFYELTKTQELERQRRLYANQQRKVHQLELDIRTTKDKALAMENTTVHDFYRRKSKKVARTAKVRQYRLNKMLSQEQKVERPRCPEQVRLEIAPRSLRNTCLVELRDLTYTFGREGHMRKEPVLKDVNLSVSAGERIVIAGANGSGKTTLVRLLLGDLEPTNGSIYCHLKMSISYLPQNTRLPEGEQVLEWFESQLTDDSICRRSHADMRTFLHRFLFSGDDVFKRIGQLSCGEMTRLQFAVFMMNSPDLLVLDEPTNHLDVRSIESIEQALQSYKGAIVVVSHDHRFRAGLKPTVVWQVDNATVHARPFEHTN